MSRDSDNAKSDAVGSAITRTKSVREYLAEMGALEDQNEHGVKGRYSFSKVLGAGGMGVVIRVEDLNLQRSVAMKMFQPGSASDESRLLRFVEEAQITSQLAHANVIPVHEMGIDADGRVFYTMNEVRGRTLRDVFKRLAAQDEEAVRNYPLSRLLDIFKKICSAVSFAHSNGVIHRDLKPQNVMIGDFGEVYVLDWGLAKIIGRDSDEMKFEQMPSSLRDENTFVTMAGTVLGTPGYMSPEQALNPRDADLRSDVWSLGAILYAILTLNAPISRKDMSRAVALTIRGKIAPPESRTKGRDLPHLPSGRVPLSLSAVAMKALSRLKEERYGSVELLREDVERYEGGFATEAESASFLRQLGLLASRHRKMLSLVGVVVLTGVLVYGWFLWQINTQRRRSVQNERKANEFRAAAEERERESKANWDALRESAPTLRELAESLLLDGQFEQAQFVCSRALELEPENVESLLLLGRIRQMQFRISDAQHSFARVLELAPANEEAQTNLELCQLLEKTSDDGQVPQMLQNLCDQGRLEEAIWLFPKCQVAPGSRASIYIAVLKKRGLKNFEMGVLKKRYVRLYAESWEYTDFSILRGIELDVLDIRGAANVVDLTDLAGMPLQELCLPSAQMLTDISPLKGMPLHSLYLFRSGVTDISALKGMPLEVLDISMCAVQDVSVLASMPLKTLHLAPERVRVGMEKLRQNKGIEGFYASGHLAIHKESALSPEAFWKRYDNGGFNNEAW